MLRILDQALQEGEGQYLEFKESTALTSKAAQALVSFANAQGGQVFFGVTDQGKPIRVQIGKNTIEELIGELERHIYPSLPLQVDQFPTKTESAGKKVIRVYVPHDVPPIIGAHLYASHALQPDKPVDAAHLQAYRRVGKRTQKIDFSGCGAVCPPTRSF